MAIRTSWARDFLARITGSIRRRGVEQRLAEEITFHVEMQAEKNVRLGMDPDDARRAALVSFGGNEQWKEAARDEYRSRPVENSLQDVRYATRSLRSAPAFSITAVLALALGIGSAAAAFCLLEGVWCCARCPTPIPAHRRRCRAAAKGRRADGADAHRR
ncbi:MAG: permease prefix domain 1-containing protein [Gemmatimonadota bacterium]|nr:permease prefix domain 1-containing protein [Gemmatimonadota bacterium]